MNITKDNNCTYIRIQDDLLESFRLEQDNVSTVTIKWVFNGSDTVSISLDTSDITDNYIDLDAEFFNQVGDTLSQGIYCFTIEIMQNTSLNTFYSSVFIDCDLLCDLAVYCYNNPEKLLFSKYEAIKYYAQCNTCDCTTLYSLYLNLLADLELTSSTTSNSNCGC